MNHLVDIDIINKKVGLRVDLNVPIENGEILNHERLLAALPVSYTHLTLPTKA